MIELKNVSKSYQTEILENINVIFDQGLIGIEGESGEGKSTLLNIISSLDEDYEGEIFFEGVNYKDIKDKEKFRFENIGMIFQNYQLFSLLDIKDNMGYFLEDNVINDSEIENILKKVKFTVNIHQKANTLSGGEKQKLAIARALFKGCKVLLCDEPTGALDHKSKEEIMQLLKELSKEILVIVVSHETSLLERYADKIYLIKNRKILFVKGKNVVTKKVTSIKNNQNHLSFKIIIRYVIKNLKAKKWRALISYFSIGLGLLCIGFSFCITSIVGKSVETQLFSAFDQNKIIINQKDNGQEYNEKYACEKSVYEQLALEYKNEVNGIGTFYFSDFETQLKDKNYFNLNLKDYSIPFAELSIRSINEYEILTEEEQVFPYFPQNLSSEEFVLSLRKKDLKRICQNLKISENETSLSDYLKNNQLSFTLFLENQDWDYQLNIDFRCAYFILGEELKIFHTSYFFNEDIFENKMKFKVDNDLLSLNQIPWTFKKIYYFEIERLKRFEIIKRILLDVNYNNFYFDFIDKNNSKYLDLESTYSRVFMTQQTKKRLDLFSLDSNLKDCSYFYSNNKSYFALDELALNSFLSLSFLVKEENQVIELIDDISITEEDVNSLSFPKEMLYGNLANNLNENCLKFSSYTNINNLFGRRILNFQEIVISNKCARCLFPSLSKKQILNQEVFFVNHAKTIVDKELFHNYYDYVKLRIVGISDEENFNIIYGDEFWATFFYVDNFSYSLSETMPTKCVVESLDKKGLISLLEKKLNNFIIVDPLLEINENILRIINYINFVLLAFSLVAIISAILMNIVSIYLFINDNQKEIALMKALGINKKSLIGLFIAFGLIIGLISLIYSTLTLLVSNCVLSYELSGSLEFFSLGAFLKAVYFMYSLTFILSLIIGLFSSFIVLKGNTLELLKEK